MIKDIVRNQHVVPTNGNVAVIGARQLVDAAGLAVRDAADDVDDHRRGLAQVDRRGAVGARGRGFDDESEPEP